MASLIVLINLILACSSVLSQYKVDEHSMCSPCEYETLMKVIGLELSCKRADDKSCREEIDSMKLHLNMLNERLENQENAMKQKLENMLNERLENQENAMKQKLENMLNERLENLENAMKQKLEEIQNHTSYAFHAMWIANTIPARYDALKFSRVSLNDHDVYHQNTGEFKTPVDGTYMFTANVCVDRNKYLNLQFLADGAVIGAFRTGDQYQASCTSSTAMSQLLKGQTVKLVVARKWGSGGLVYNNEQGYLSSFSGMLIK